MKYDQQLGDLKTHLTNAKSVLIALPAQITVDKLAAGLALTLSLKAQGKDAAVITQDTVRVSHTNLFGVGEVKNQLPQNSSGNYTISLEGVVDTATNTVPSLEKLDWYPEGTNLNLVFHTVPGAKFEPKNISTKVESGNFNLIFVLGAVSLNDLGEIYPMNIAQFSGVPIVNIDLNPSNSNFGYINIVDPQAGSICEILAQVMPSLGLNIDQDIASNILTGVYDATTNLTVNMKPDTFIVVGQAMQSGGQLPATSNQAIQQPQSSYETPPATQPQYQPQPAAVPQPQISPTQGFDLSKVFQIPPVPQNLNSQPVTNNQASTQEVPTGEYATTQTQENINPAPDWLTPKIYKGGSLG